MGEEELKRVRRAGNMDKIENEEAGFLGWREKEKQKEEREERV